MKMTEEFQDPGAGETSVVIREFARALDQFPKPLNLPFRKVFLGNMPSERVRRFLRDLGFGFMFSGEKDIPNHLRREEDWIPEPSWWGEISLDSRFDRALQGIDSVHVPPFAYILPACETVDQLRAVVQWTQDIQITRFRGAQPKRLMGIDVGKFPDPSEITPFKNAISGISLTVPKGVDPSRWRPFVLWAQARDLWVHLRKVHGGARMEQAFSLGVDSIDSAASMMGDGTVRFVSTLRNLMLTHRRSA